MGTHSTPTARTGAPARWTRATVAEQSRGLKRHSVDLRSGARWQDLPERFPPYQTCHRRFQQWVRAGVLRAILEALAEDLRTRGEVDLSECFIDATFIVAKKRTGRGSDQAG